MSIIGLHRMLQTWMIDFIYGLDGVYVDDATRTSDGVTIGAQVSDTTYTKSDMWDELENIKAKRLFKDLAISVDEDEIDVSFKDNVEVCVCTIMKKHIKKLNENDMTPFLNACHSEITDIANDFYYGDDNVSGTDWETEIHNTMLRVLEDVLKKANAPIGNKIESYLWEE